MQARIVYVYAQTVPRGGLIEEWDAAPVGEPKLWLKLWRDLVWTALRGIPATREPYDRRAALRPATDGLEAWDQLAYRPMASVPLSSTSYLGAQATTTENASFRDVAERSVLLHFWPFVVPIYVPAVIGRDGNHHFVGYALAVPDIIDLEGFVRNWPTVARERRTEPAGYRPRDAVIALASEAGLDLARRALAVTARQGGDAEVRPWLGAVDVVHVEKEGHHVRVRSLRRVDLHRDRVAAYARVREAYWTTAFRRQQISNILEGRPWWGGAGRLCTITAAARTIGDVRFRHDVRIAGMEIETEIKMTDTASGGAQTLDHVIYQAARAYVLGRLRSKYGLSWDPALAGNPVWRSEYEAKRERVAREAFLAVRARTGVAFVGYFATMIGSVPQRLGERAFLEVARALRDDQEIERVRSLTLLALSASA